MRECPEGDGEARGIGHVQIWKDVLANDPLFHPCRSAVTSNAAKMRVMVAWRQK